LKNILSKIYERCRESWHLFLLAGIVLLALKIRLFTSGTEWLQAYDPYYHLRYTSYIFQYGRMPVWDPLSYFPPGRPVVVEFVMYHMTAWLYVAFEGVVDSLMEFAKYSTAFYGAAVTIPAYFAGKEFAGKEAGILSALFMAAIPAAIRRTSAGFYSTDPFVLFFSVLSIYFFARSFKRRDLLSYSLTAISLILFSISWTEGWYIAVLAIGSIVVYYVALTVLGKDEWKTGPEDDKKMPSIKNRASKAINPFIKLFIPSIFTLVLAMVVSHLIGMEPFSVIGRYTAFVLNPENLQIVNISVAELQPLDILGGGWQQLYGRTSVALLFLFPGILMLLKRKKRLGSLLFAWAGFTFFFVTRGIRFMLIFAPAVSVAAGVGLSELYRKLDKLGEYSPLIAFGFLASIFISTASPGFAVALATVLTIFILLVEGEGKVPDIAKAVMLAVIIISGIMVTSQGIQSGAAQPDTALEDHWRDAYEFMKYETAEDAVIGSWWDPGHRIAGLAQRRNMADGAHCLEEHCEGGLNTRISDLGEMLVTDDEDRMVELMERYQEEASEVYWIASEDLIGKYQWPQYFATGCRGGDPQCPLYSQLRYQEQEQDKIIYEANVYLEFVNDTPVPVYETAEGRGTFERMVYYENGELTEKTFDDERTIPGTLWVHPQYYTVVLIPEYQEKSMFTKMYFFEGEGIDNFDQVFRNDYVKIYKLNQTVA